LTAQTHITTTYKTILESRENSKIWKTFCFEVGNEDSEAVSIKTTIVLIVEEYSLKTIKKSILNDAVSSVRYLYPKLINSTIF
jgi:hypothetical protein